MLLNNNYLKRLKLVATEQNYRLYLYKPTMIKPLLLQFEHMKLVRRIRYLIEYLHIDHYKVFYLTIVDEVVGFCVIARGGRRLKVSTKQDIVLGPYYIDKEKRGKGYSIILIKMCLKYYGSSYLKAFDWVEKKNIPSINASELCGFYKIGEIKIQGIMRKLVSIPSDSDVEGTAYVFQYDMMKDGDQ